MIHERYSLVVTSASRPHLLGAVLNRVDIVRNKYYYSRYYGYKYKNYYVKSDAA